jgi:hypothetical protein
VTDPRLTVRSYQRIFSPERRIHQIEGRPLPVPGGVPLRWLGWATGSLIAVLALVGTFVGGAALGVIDWPIRLVVVPVAVATAATQATPDGRRPERFAASWIALRLAPPRRSLGRGLPRIGERQPFGGRIWVSPDHHGPRLRHGRISGPAFVSFSRPVEVRRSPRRRGLVARPTGAGKRDPGRAYTRIALERGETLEVRP